MTKLVSLCFSTAYKQRLLHHTLAFTAHSLRTCRAYLIDPPVHELIKRNEAVAVLVQQLNGPFDLCGLKFIALPATATHSSNIMSLSSVSTVLLVGISSFAASTSAASQHKRQHSLRLLRGTAE